MGNSALSTYVKTLVGFDDDLEKTSSEDGLDFPDGPDRRASLVPNGAGQQPQSPLHQLQVDQAWEALLSAAREAGQSADSIESLQLAHPIRVAVLDTGVWPEHEALIGRVGRVRNFVPRWFQGDAHEDLARDRGGSGTFCAALLAGGAFPATPEAGGPHQPLFYNGVAPFVKLVVGKTLDSTRRGDVDWLIKGLKWAADIDKTDSRRVVSADVIAVTVGMPRHHAGLRAVLYQALARGKVVVCCASQEERASASNIQYPARFGDVICVGSQAENGQPAGFTPAGREVDFLGPGEDVWSASSKGANLVRKASGNYMSAPYVAGVCALLLAYAEIVGGPDLRHKVSHTHVMRKLLKRMSAMPGHHDPSAGFGNIVPHRMLRYGPKFFINSVSEILQESKPGPETSPTPLLVDPLQPVLHEFSASAISTRIRRDQDAIRGLMRPLLRERLLHTWYTGLDNLFFGEAGAGSGTIVPELSTKMSAKMQLVDLSIPRSHEGLDDFSNKITGINVEQIGETYFGDFEGIVEQLILPEFRHVLELAPKDSSLCKLVPASVYIPGTVPLQYLLHVLRVCALCPNSRLASMIIDSLDLEQVPNLHPVLQARCKEIMTTLSNVTDLKVKVCVHDLVVSKDLNVQQELLQMFFALSSGTLCEQAGVSNNAAKAQNNVIFLPDSELPEGFLANAEEQEEEEKNENDGYMNNFILFNELSSFLGNWTRGVILREFPNKVKALMKAASRSYDGALYVITNSYLGDHVTSVDLRLDELKLRTPEGIAIDGNTDDDTKLRIPSSVCSSSDIAFDDLRMVSLVALFAAMNANSSPNCVIQEIVLPPLKYLSELSKTIQSPLLKKCRNLYLTGETALVQLLLILRCLPKGEYALVLHVQCLRITSQLGKETSRDFDTPPGVRVVIYDHSIEANFIEMPDNVVKTVYEICLKVASVPLLEKLKAHCVEFLQSEDAIDYISYCRLNSACACRTLIAYVDDALQSGILSADDSILVFSRDVFKFQVMTSAIGKRRFRLAFKSSEDQSRRLLPNFYKHTLSDLKEVTTALKDHRINNVTVAVFGMGINAFHPEFFSKISHLRSVRRERGCPYGDNIIGLAFNAVEESSLDAILDDDCTIGTISAALIAGNTCGAAPFANLISLKTGRVTGESRSEWVAQGLAWIMAQEKRGVLPVTDVIMIPFTFSHFDWQLYKYVNEASAAGKILVCTAGRSSVFDGQRISYPGFYGDVLCIGSHDPDGEASRFTGKGREVDLLALGELPPTTGASPGSERWGVAVAAAHVAGVIAYTLAFAELAGGASLRQAVSNNSTMREILRRMCSKPEQHDERTGHGCLNPALVFKYGEDHFRHLVSEITEEYYEISLRRLTMSQHQGTPRTRSRSKTVSGYSAADHLRRQDSQDNRHPASPAAKH